NDTKFQLAACAFLGCLCQQGVCACVRVHTAGIRNHAHTAIHDRRHNALHRTDEVACITERRVSFTLLLEDGHRDFSQIVQHQVINGAAFHLTLRCIESVAPESLAARHPDDSLHSTSPAPLAEPGTAHAEAAVSVGY